MDREALSKRYDHVRAASYEAERTDDSRWEMEHHAVATFLSRLSPGSSVLDAPVGTGRFIGLYRDLEMAVTGVDASQSMLDKAIEAAAKLGAEVRLRVGDLFSLGFPASSFDAVVCMRFLNWVDSDDVRRAIEEFTRVSRSHLVIAVEEYTPGADFNLLRPSDFRRRALQIKRRCFMWRTNSDYVYHTRAVIRRAFLACNLEVVDQVQIPRKKDEGIDYRVFFLRKTLPSDGGPD